MRWGCRLVAYFVIPNYPNANYRHYYFLQQGLHDVAEEMAERGVAFAVRRPSDGDSLEAFLDEVDAAMLVGDENVCREPERWRKVLAEKLKIPFLTVDADVVAPSAVFGKTFVLLHHFRPHLQRALPEFLVPVKRVKLTREWKKKLSSYSLKKDITEGFDKLDRTVGPVDTFTGGTKAALKRLRQFADTQLADYDDRRNHPEARGTSQMSPYLHYGHISPITIALAVEDAVTREEG